MSTTVGPAPPAWFRTALAALLERRDLSGVQMCELMHGLLSGACGEVETAALLVALAAKGETADELAAAAAVMREHRVPFLTGRADLLDTCGTGGDGPGTFNISTATALVVAGAGVPVVKHGNRAVSSRSGSADVLAALGVAVETDLAAARRCLERAGMAFCLAPHFHPSLRHVGSVRRRLGVGTLFNCLGPLANPAGAAYQLLGVARPDWLDRMAGALARLGTRHALLVCGRDGLDEVSLSAPTLVREVRSGAVTAREWTAADFGLGPCALAELLVSGPEQSAAVVRGVLAGEDGAPRRVVLANAAAALLAAERVTDLRAGVAMAADAIGSGRAAKVLADLVAVSKESQAPAP
ncbi:MAG TPA: anthranilate phosphoribosyltransferase [Gemmataceae bacterium]|jgi:anthranilate phosphoribosyltransferase|nr:anthranilate phosphoribosyltransferase [Gemmataceae bacterium]